MSWDFLTETLNAYNFGSSFVRMIKTFYFNETNFSRILLDGNLGTKIHMQKGIRQGDPASGYLFDLAMEPLTCHILQSKQIRGIMIAESEVRLSQYADDVVIFSAAGDKYVRGVFNELERFTAVSGLHINKEKTSVCR